MMKKIAILIGLMIFCDLKADTEDAFMFINDLKKLDQKILDTEKAILINENNVTSVDFLENLKNNLVVIKSNYEAFLNSSSIDEQIEKAKNKKWKNTIIQLSVISKLCEGSNIVVDDCLLAIGYFRQSVEGRSLSYSDKDELIKFSDLYSKKIEARAVMNSLFIEKINILLGKSEKLFEFSKKPTLMVKINPVKLIIRPKEVKVTDEKHFFENKKFGPVVMSALFVVLSLIFCGFLKNKKHSRNVKKYYSKIYFSAKRNNIKIKIFGSLNAGELLKLTKIEKNIVEVLVASNSFTNEGVVRFKKSHSHLIIETKFDISESIQHKMNSFEAGLFTSKIAALQQKIQALGGELLFVDKFNERGENTSSTYSIIFPLSSI